MAAKIPYFLGTWSGFPFFINKMRRLQYCSPNFPVYFVSVLSVGQVQGFERVIQVEQSNVYRHSSHAERHCVADEVSYLERLVKARKLLMEKCTDTRRELERCQESIAQLGDAIDLLDSIFNNEEQFNEPDRGA